ncbi:hypothetical protein [Pedobacter nototheniae]|uniref:hypothetical protein n=1 Tax=Pedobacter nototheniae TaxID=2488994 RepID=UPI00103DB0E5|nr:MULTISPECIES: hypothetical protein [Pedobacter]
MKNKIIGLMALGLGFAIMITACKKETTPYNNPFFHIMVDNKSAVEVLSNRKDTVNYNVYLSAELQFDPINVQYQVTIGDGLKEGRDFELITKGTTLTFPQGIFERPIKIAWKEAALDATKDNTITISLISNSKNYTLGLPGPDQLQKKLVITKK